TMKAIVVNHTGGPEVLKLEQTADPKPAEGQAVVKHRAAGVNFIDIYHRRGAYPKEVPFVPGLEAAGTVESGGPGVTAGKPRQQSGLHRQSRRLCREKRRPCRQVDSAAGKHVVRASSRHAAAGNDGTLPSARILQTKSR